MRHFGSQQAERGQLLILAQLLFHIHHPFVELRLLDGDGGQLRQGREDVNFFVREAVWLAGIDAECADRLATIQQRHAEQRHQALAPRHLHAFIPAGHLHVLDLQRLLSPHHDPEIALPPYSNGTLSSATRPSRRATSTLSYRLDTCTSLTCSGFFLRTTIPSRLSSRLKRGRVTYASPAPKLARKSSHSRLSSSSISEHTLARISTQASRVIMLRASSRFSVELIVRLTLASDSNRRALSRTCS